MGVKGLWQLLEPVGRPVTLESLDGKVLAVDASILLNQAVKGMRDKSGQPLPNAHLVVLFNRLCKLLFYRVKPVFVFDGGVPVLKKKTLAARKERKLKARYGSNKATEKLIKNYLKGKALESVTGIKSDNTLLRSKSPREPDVFELHSLPEAKSENSEEESEVSLLEEFYAQSDFESQFQDPSKINVDSEDFRCLPEEIQHELIRDKMEEKTFTGRHEMPEDGSGFSSFQLQNVLQRGKLHQRLDELRKNMNNRNTGEISGLSSQGPLGSEYSVQSRRIVSQDTGHYILVKTNRADDDNADCPEGDDRNQGGFFCHQQELQPAKLSVAPSFGDIDLTCEHDSDSGTMSPLMYVPEIDLTLNTYGTKLTNTAENVICQERKSECLYECSGGRDGPGKFGDSSDSDAQEQLLENSEWVSKQSVGFVDSQVKSKMTQVSNELFHVVNATDDQTDPNKLYRSIKASEKSTNEENISIKKPNKAITTEETFDIRSREVNAVVNDAIVEEDNHSEGHTTQYGDVYDSCASSSATLIQDTETNDAEIQKRKAEIESLLKSRQIQIPSPLHGETRHDKQLILDEGQEAQTTSNVSSEFVLQLESSEEESSQTEISKELPDFQTENGEIYTRIIPVNKKDNKDIQSLNEENASLLSSDENKQSNIAVVVSEFAGSSKEDLQAMQVNLEMEQSLLQNEQARQARAAASVSNEMLNESQELLRLFGVPYLVSPMEAEAQCAFLDLTHQTHGTITDDSDVLLFGGQRVYKNLFTHNKHPELYTIEAINGGFALNRSQLIKLAMITGSDYTEGIQGLGAVSAMEVLHEFNHEGFEALQKFKKWHEDNKVSKLTTQETKVKKKLRTINLPTGFPSREVFDSYISPVVDETRGSFEWGKPDLHSLRLFAKERLGWTTRKTDEVLLPVLKNLNQIETQKRIESFFPIRFQETRKKSSKRVRRVVKRFLNPDELSESSSEEDNESQKTDKKTEKSPTKPAAKGKSRGLRQKQSSSCSSRRRGRPNMEKSKIYNDEEDRLFDRDLLIESDGEFEHLIAGESLNELIRNKNITSDCNSPPGKLQRSEKKEKSAIEKTRSEKPLQVRNKRKFPSDSWEFGDVIPPNHDRCQETPNVRNNDGIHKGNKTTSGVSNSNSSTSSDSEDELNIQAISRHIIPKSDKTIKDLRGGSTDRGGRAKRAGRGRRGRVKRLKTFNAH